MTTFADGGDGGGSIRIPASACGIFGYKPPFGRNPLDITVPLESLIHFGVMTRTVAETAALQNVMSGPHLADICSLRSRLRIPNELEGVAGWKVALSMDLGYVEVDSEVRDNTLKAAQKFRDLGCEVEEVELGWHSGVLNQYLRLYETLFASSLTDFLADWRYEMDPKVVDLVERGQRLSAVEVNRVNRTRGEMYAKLGPILQRYDIMICPTLALPAVPADHTSMDPNFSINGKTVEPLMGWLLTYQFNMMSQCPVASVPTGFARSGVPTGLQIVARTYDDMRVFRAASAYEAAVGGWMTTPQTRPAL
jgi:amidase